MNIPFSSKPGGPLPAGVSKPTWVIVDVAGPLPARQPTNPIAALLSRSESLESLAAKFDKLSKAEWLHGVLLRFGTLETDLASAHALQAMLRRLSETKRTVSYLPSVNKVSLLAASGAQEVVAPESAEFMLHGFGAEITYLGAFLKKHGIDFENLRIGEFKSALTRFSQDHMDVAQRLQTAELLRSMEDAWAADLAEARGVSENAVRQWLGEGVSSARRAHELGLISKVAYEDELIGPATRPLAAVIDLLMPEGGKSKAGRIALVPVIGNIVTGKSRNNPLPLPLLGGAMAGSDTVVAALRRAKEDKQTRAIVLYVDSGGGSALASDLIWREVMTSEKPVVAVMGSVAASGGYYVLAHAAHVIASPYTITGSIGVVTGKPVFKEFNQRQGFTPERVERQDNALIYSSSQPFSDAERAELERGIAEVYQRFVSRVAEGRKLSVAQVDSLGRGRVWSGPDALTAGLVDELGDLHTGLQRACELAGLSYDAPVWTATPPNRGPLPEFAQQAAAVSLRPPFLNDQTLLWLDLGLQLK
ncbi:S49 family peptidase [Deinococcus rubellus]|uniref:S49 family peptidase n=1 Tax=Deinococcus rubellus TaxID=1889240 RepID=A0ABY5YDA7_9DEIO|nr:S49 family peptidase [Deinococcus rubellus]UWX62906.1 S49 family peptidase [Deinococcus rubellus]